MSLGRAALWIASLGALALAARSVLVEPIPLLAAALALGSYVSLVVAGVLFPRLEMYGSCLSRGRRDTSAVALTFDDGPHPKSTRRILEILAEHDAVATFFVIGEKAERHPDVIREILEAGHALGLHSYRHERLYSIKPPAEVEHDLRHCQDVIYQAASVAPRWFRPPIGHLSPRTAAGARRAEVEVVGWSVRGLDGMRRARPDRVVTRVASGLGPGAIVLLHDAAERDDYLPASIDALPRILQLITERGLQTCRLEQLV